jgi:hypothetical protein
MAKKPPSPPAGVIAFRATIEWIEPAITRDLLVPDSWTLEQLHRVLQVAFDWDDSHLHEFVFRTRRFSSPEAGIGEDVEDESEVALRDLELRTRMRLRYLYDFGDSWEIDLRVTRVSEAGPGDPPWRVWCAAGARAGPPEDCGGVGGYDDLVEAMRAGRGERYDELLESFGEPFDPEVFSLADLNTRLARIR